MNKILEKLGVGGGILGLILVVIFLLIVGPLLLIWGLNLMGIAVAYTWKTILGAFFVTLVLRGSSSKD